MPQDFTPPPRRTSLPPPRPSSGTRRPCAYITRHAAAAALDVLAENRGRLVPRVSHRVARASRALLSEGAGTAVLYARPNVSRRQPHKYIIICIYNYSVYNTHYYTRRRSDRWRTLQDALRNVRRQTPLPRFTYAYRHHHNIRKYLIIFAF